MQYRNPGMDQDLIGREAILNSIEMRWHKSDQELFIAAVIANPCCSDNLTIGLRAKGTLGLEISKSPTPMYL